jgi:endonuclease YncB( thermonuclease family)
MKTTDKFPPFSLNGIKALAKVVNVYDGDTFKACMEHDGIMRKYTFRTLRYDAAEIKPLKSIPNREQHIALAIKGRDLLRSLILGEIVMIHCEKFDKYGRVLANVYIKNDNVNQLMIDSGLVQLYQGGKRPEHPLKELENIKENMDPVKDQSFAYDDGKLNLNEKEKEELKIKKDPHGLVRC